MNEKVMIAGHLCLDFCPGFRPSGASGFDEVFVPGKLILVGDALLTLGGAVPNTGLAMERLGMDTLLNGKIGDDAFGGLVRDILGPDQSAGLKIVPDQKTSYTLVLSPPGVDRMFLHYPGSNDTFGAQDVDYEAAAECVLFHFGYPTLLKRMYADGGRELLGVFRRVKELALTTSLDFALPDPASEAGRADWRAILERVLPLVDVFPPSIEEIAFMLDRPLFEKRKTQAAGSDAVQFYKTENYAHLAETLLAMGAGVVVIKAGDRGCYLRTAGAARIKAMGRAAPSHPEDWADRELWGASFHAENFVSALGAGDASIAGFLGGVIRGHSPEESLQIANLVGWQNVRVADALSGLEDWAGTLALLKSKEDMVVNSADLTGAGWRRSKSRSLWYGPNDVRQ